MRSSPESATDADLLDLVERSRLGDRDAFRSLYLSLHGPVARFVARRVRSRADAEDLTSRVFFKLLDRLDDFDGRRGSVRMFVIAVARNAVIDHHRTVLPSVPIEDACDVLADGGTPLAALLANERTRTLSALVAELPVETREMFVLRYGDGLKHHEIATVLGVDVDVVKQRFSRALRGLRERLAERGMGREEEIERGAEGAVIDVG